MGWRIRIGDDKKMDDGIVVKDPAHKITCVQVTPPEQAGGNLMVRITGAVQENVARVIGSSAPYKLSDKGGVITVRVQAPQDNPRYAVASLNEAAITLLLPSDPEPELDAQAAREA